ncbi:hypothetical protein [Oryzobacter terrae]|uniref:hypothetical protein n=1 Tax=Oryzobacter terrae TaxID=1620385 RepID=UPI00366D1E35
MARELTGSQQARQAGVWDRVRPEALVPRERDPVTGSLSGRRDADGGVKGRRTEAGPTGASTPVTPARVPKGRWPAVASVAAVALVIGVGGAVALATRDSGPGRNGAVGPTTTAANPGSSPGSTPRSVSPSALQERSYTGTMTSTSQEGGSQTTPMSVGVSCTDTECRLVGWSMSDRPMTWAPAATSVTGVLPKIGEVTNICDGAQPFAPQAAWAMTISDDALDFTVSNEKVSAGCPGGGSAGAGGSVIEFDGTRDR